MTQRTRYFLVGSGLVVFVGLGAGVVAYYTGSLPLRASAIGPTELAYVPGDVTVVAFADVRSVMNSQFRQKLQQMLPTGAARDEMLAETGIDVERDIDTVVAVSNSMDPLQADSVVLLRGRFDDKHLEKLASDRGAKAEDYGGKHLLLAETAAPAPGGPGGPAAIAFLEPGLIAMGTAPAVKRAIDVAKGHQDVTRNAEMMSFIAGVQDSGNAWVVGRVADVAGKVDLPAQVSEQLSTLQWFALSARIDSGVSGLVRAQARDDKAGDDLRAVLNGAIAAGRMMASQDPTVGSVLNSLQATGTGKNIEVSFTLPPEIVSAMSGALPSRGGGPGRGAAPAGMMPQPKTTH